jgi:ABC-2 type transport system ATP-binding protein
MRPLEYLHFFGEIYGLDFEERERRAQKLLADFGLAGAVNRRIGEFSKGMRQKLALGRALLHKPPVLLLDEPTSAMDPESARLVRDAIKELQSTERTVVICTHNLAEAEELADRIAIIRHGTIIANDTPANLKMQLLGPAIFEIRLGQPLNGRQPDLPESIQLQDKGDNWLRFCTDNPEVDNPRVVNKLVAQKFEILGLHEVPRSLEQVYLQAVLNRERADAG